MKFTPFDCLVAAETTGSGLLKLLDSEIELFVVPSGVELRGGAAAEPMVPLNERNSIDSTKTQWVDRESNLQVSVTTHRLVVYNQKSYRYLHLSNIFSSTIESILFKSPKIILTTAVGEVVLAFTTGSDRTKRRDDLYEQLKLSSSRKQWEVASTQAPQKPVVSRRRVGVDAILTASKQRHDRNAHLTDTAFEGDAEQLLKEAVELVAIIRKYVATLDHNNDNEEKDQLVNMLQDMGMTSALKKEDYGDTYYDITARQVADFVRPKLQLTPVLTLTDVYCLFNRARGSNLVSPEDLVKAVERLEHLNIGISLQTFESGLKVLRDETFSDDRLAHTCLDLCRTHGCLTALSFSRATLVPTTLALEQLKSAEQAEFLVRDETLESIRFYPNRFAEWT